MVRIALVLGLFAAQDVTDETFEKVHASIIPRAHEMIWREIPWRPVFWDAVIEAQQKERPILLWGMNGHPLACT